MQPITPVEIRQKSFEKRFRGYNTDEVDAFLHSLAYAWEQLTTQLDQAKAALKESNKEVNRLYELENAILKTIKDSELTAHNIIEQAQKEADLKTRETKLELEKLLRETTKKAKMIEEDNAKMHQQAKEKMARELERTKEMIQEAETYRDTWLQKLQHLAEDILAKGKAIKKEFPSHLVSNKEATKRQEDIPDSTQKG